MSDEWMDLEYGGPSAWDGSINLQNPAPWDGAGGGGVDPYALPTSDPRSPWYYPAESSSSYVIPNQLPFGGGAWQNMDTGATGQVYTPPSYPSFPTEASITPGGQASRVVYSDPTDAWLKSRAANEAASWANYNATFPAGGGSMPAGGGGPTGGQRAVANQTPQMISLGTPERRMYDLYTGLVSDPSSMGQNPAYKFLYNQGEQAMNRGLAAKRLQYSGKGMNDQMQFGQGMAFNFMNQMLPQYRGAAQEELARFMGPAGLLPRYQAGNNATIAQAGQEAAARDLMPLYQQMLAGGGGGSMPGAGIGMGGISSSYNPTQYQASQTPTFQPRLAQASGDSGYNLYDLMDDSSFTG